MPKLSTEQWIGNVIERYPNRHLLFDYSKVDYKLARVKVEIICKKCDKSFHQTPNDHYSGKGCPHCVNRYKTTSSYLRDVLDKYPENLEKYDYSRLEYKTDSDKVLIGCKDCGAWFEQTAGKHLIGRGCNICRGGCGSLTSFTNNLLSKYPNLSRLDFSESVYVNYKTNLSYKCTGCGDICQKTPSNLLKGLAGCACEGTVKGFNFNKPAKLYITRWQTPLNIIMKVGITSNQVYQRCYFTSQKLPSSYTYEILHEFNFKTGEEAFSVESAIKRKFSAIMRYADRCEFPDGWTETFSPEHYDDILNAIQELING